MHLFLKLTKLLANNCIKLLLLTSEQNLCEMALVKNAARNGAVCYHHDSKEIFVLLCLFLPQGPTLYSRLSLRMDMAAVPVAVTRSVSTGVVFLEYCVTF